LAFAKHGSPSAKHGLRSAKHETCSAKHGFALLNMVFHLLNLVRGLLKLVYEILNKVMSIILRTFRFKTFPHKNCNLLLPQKIDLSAFKGFILLNSLKNRKFHW